MGIWDDYDYDPGDLDRGEPYSRARNITCNRCGQTGLEWGATLAPGKWVLLSSRTMNPHTCPQRGPASPDEFPSI